MTSDPAASFASPHVFAVCNAGSERLLKAVVALTHRDLHPAYMRPQLMTWKAPSPVSRPPLNLFARVSGLSLGIFDEAGKLNAALEPFRDKPFHLHVFPREAPVDGLSLEEWANVDARTGELRASLAAAGFEVYEERAPRLGEWVLDVVLGVDDAGKFLAGVHRHSSETHPRPGALPRIALPPDVPSRAWLKLEQALVFGGWDAPGQLRGKSALELGSSPGGASLSLLQHGVTVFGVDAAEMDPRVRDFASPDGARFVHFKMNTNQMPHELLPRQVDLLVCDLNAAPQVVIPIVEELQERVRASMFVLTMKLNDEATMARIPEFLRRLRRFAPAPVRATQLAANRSEFCVVAGR
jgi:23S rRNA (cytidine2498-2'-O)-methyltransferase